jgi:hypothetical protein
MNLFQNIGNWFNNQKQQGDLVRSQREMANQYLQTNPVRPEPQKVSFDSIKKNPLGAGLQVAKNMTYQDPTGFVPMGTAKKLSPLIKGSNFLRQDMMPGVNSIKGDIVNYAKQMTEQYRQNNIRFAQEQAKKLQQARQNRFFQSVPQRYQPEQLIMSYINKFKR